MDGIGPWERADPTSADFLSSCAGGLVCAMLDKGPVGV